MEEIKCRFWNTDVKKWSYGFPCVFPTEKDGITSRFKVTEGYEIVFYTGLKDKNGKEIYEGDILHISSPPKEDNWVEYYEGEWMLYPHGLGLPDWYGVGEVIGNIWENKELLEQ